MKSAFRQSFRQLVFACCALLFLFATPVGAAAVQAENAFTLILECDPLPSKPGLCTRAESSARLAMGRIASEFKFRRPITVRLKLKLPCGKAIADITCPDMMSSAAASPAQDFRVRHMDGGQVLLYPVALLKQLDLAPGDGFNWPAIDIEAKVNMLENWWFPGDPMTDNSNDFEAIILHETLHGLGFGSVNSLTRYPDSVTSTMVLPWHESAPVSDLPISSRTNRFAFHRFADPSIFERLITISPKQPAHPLAAAHGDASSITTYPRALTAAVDRLVKEGKLSPLQNNTDVKTRVFQLPQVEGALLADPDARSLIAHFTRLATTESTLQLTPSAWSSGGSNVTPSSAPFTLETSFNTFIPGSSVTHIQTPDMLRLDKNPNLLTNFSIAGLTPNFIMMPIPIAVSLEDRIKASGAPKSGIGPGIKAAMLAMGYTDASADGFVSRRGVSELVDAGGAMEKQGGVGASGAVGLEVGSFQVGICLAVSLLVVWLL